MGRRAVASSGVLRGQIWLADVGLAEPKRFVVISNNERNRRLGDVLGVRLTTAPKPPLPSILELRPGEAGPARSYAVADDILPLAKGDLIRSVGALSLTLVNRLEDALHAALGLTR